MNLLRKAKHVHATGRSGTGKTSICERFIVGSNYGEVFIFDHQSELHSRLGVQPYYRFEDVFRETERRVKAYDPSYEFAGRFNEAFQAFSSAVFQRCRNRKMLWETLLVCDELQIVNDFHTPALGMSQIFQTGRRFGVDSFTMSQQPNKIPGIFREQFTELYFTQLIDPNSLKFPVEFGLDPDAIRNLQVTDGQGAEYLWLNTRTGEQRRSTLKFRS